MLDLDAIEARARALIEFADGLEDAGQEQTARRSRMVARDCVDVVEELRGLEGACRTLKQRNERALDLILARGYAATRDALDAIGAGGE